jgi:hypothetical protein
MIRYVAENEIKYIPFARYNSNGIEQCNNPNIGYVGRNVSVAALTKEGLEIVKARIATVVSADNSGIKIKAIESFGYDDKIFAMINSKIDCRGTVIIFL